MQALTFDDIVIYVTEQITKEGASPSPAYVRMMANQALAEISEASGGIVTAWDNSASGSLVLTASTAPLPVDCLLPLRVEYGGSDNKLDRATTGELDKDTPGWRDTTGDPSKWAIEGANLVLDSAPSSATGKLVMRGWGMLPAFLDPVDGVVQPNPLVSLPYPRQLAPAYFVVANYPVTPAKPATNTQEGFLAANQETQRRITVRAEHRALWERERGLCVDAVRARTEQQLSY
jgi:hypothetical protein